MENGNETSADDTNTVAPSDPPYPQMRVVLENTTITYYLQNKLDSMNVRTSVDRCSLTRRFRPMSSNTTQEQSPE